MSENELGKILKNMYEGKDAGKGVKKTTMIHLFGVIYAIEIRSSELRQRRYVRRLTCLNHIRWKLIKELH